MEQTSWANLFLEDMVADGWIIAVFGISFKILSNKTDELDDWNHNNKDINSRHSQVCLL